MPIDSLSTQSNNVIQNYCVSYLVTQHAALTCNARCIKTEFSDAEIRSGAYKSQNQNIDLIDREFVFFFLNLKVCKNTGY